MAKKKKPTPRPRKASPRKPSARKATPKMASPRKASPRKTGAKKAAKQPAPRPEAEAALPAADDAVVLDAEFDPLDEPVRVTEAMLDLPKSLTPKQRLFLAAYANTGSITKAAELADAVRAMHYEQMLAPPPEGKEQTDYQAAFAHVTEVAIDLLETEARRRAIRGVRKPATIGGKPVYVRDPKTGEKRLLWEKDYSDALLARLLAAHRPETYTERRDVRFRDETPKDEAMAEMERLAAVALGEATDGEATDKGDAT